MILVRAPLRVTFVGDGTDLLAFSTRSPGRLLSATIDKFIYLVIKTTPLLNKFIVKYQSMETVTHPRDLSHDRIRTALLDLNIISKGIEIGSFADIPAKTGLGSSGSFSVALLKGLNAYLGKTMSAAEAAKAACRLEIELLKEPIGKQDQYAAAFGGFNIFQFNTDTSVTVEPILLDYRRRALLKEHLVLFYTGLTRQVKSVLTKQSAHVNEYFATYQKMAAAVEPFHEALLQGDIEKMAALFDEEWERKKTLSSNVTNPIINELYHAAKLGGAMAGKVMGAGDGGCLLFFVSPERRLEVGTRLRAVQELRGLLDAQEIPFEFMQSGTDVLVNNVRGKL